MTDIASKNCLLVILILWYVSFLYSDLISSRTEAINSVRKLYPRYTLNQSHLRKDDLHGSKRRSYWDAFVHCLEEERVWQCKEESKRSKRAIVWSYCLLILRETIGTQSVDVIQLVQVFRRRMKQIFANPSLTSTQSSC